MASQGPSLQAALKNNFALLVATCAAVVLLGMLAVPVSCDDGGNNFFLKASKSVPRIGRRSENFFLKASKTVPRIGRRSQLVDGREGAVGSWPWYRTSDTIPGPSRRADQTKEYNEPIYWNEVDKVLEHNPEMWTPAFLNELISHKEDLEYQRRLQAMTEQA